MASLTLEKLTKRYPGGVEPVRQIDLHVPHGTFVCLVGPSGCGKSTLLSMIAGLEPVTSGAIRFDNRDVTRQSPRERDVAMVFQSYALYPHKTVFENLAFPLRNRSVEKESLDRQVRGAAKRLGLLEFLERFPRELSGGQRQRVALGRALVREPQVFLFDEPLSNLDPALRGQMRAEIKRLHEDLGATFVYVTHDQAEAMTLADRVVVLSKGAIQQDAPPTEVYARPSNLFVARFMGSPPMSVLRARATSEGLTLDAGVIPLPGTTGVDGRTVLVGVRAEDVTLTDSPTGLEGEIDVVEPMGAETYITVRLKGDSMVIARVEPGFGGRRRDPVRVQLRPDALHLFDPESERRIDLS